jgi:predicted dehydrogenase
VPNFYVNAGRSALSNAARRVAGRDPDYFGPTYHYRAHYDALSAFLDAIRDGRDPPVGGREALRTLELVEATYEAAEESDGSAPGESPTDRWPIPEGPQ